MYCDELETTRKYSPKMSACSLHSFAYPGIVNGKHCTAANVLGFQSCLLKISDSPAFSNYEKFPRLCFGAFSLLYILVYKLSDFVLLPT